jgi:hypothetical protein
MRSFSWKTFSVFTSLWVVVLLLTHSTMAQSGISVRLMPPQAVDYPKVTAFLDVHDSFGEFIHGLTQNDITVVENGKSLPVEQLLEQRPGVQFVITFSPGHSLSIRDVLGNSRFDYLVLALSLWNWNRTTDSADDLSLVTADGPEVVHSAEPAAVITALQDYHPDLRDTQPSLDVLNRALQIAEDASENAGMERAILFITPPQPSEAIPGMQSLAARASELGIRVFVWLVTAPDATIDPGTIELQNLALQTGGAFFTFTGSETVPDLETYLEPLRYIYELSYTSAITTTGTLPLYVDVNISGQSFPSNTQEITLNLRPPNPIFVSPPVEILRSLREVDESRWTALKETPAEWLPEEQPLQVLFEFPDGYQRSLVRTVLYVDGSPLQTNDSPPFDQFTWDVRPYTESGTHRLQVEAVDSLGLTGKSIEVPVQVTVDQPVRGFQLVLSSRGLILAGTLVLLSGVVLGLVLVLGGRIRPQQPGKNASPPKKRLRQSRFKRGASRSTSDPVTQPVKPKAEEVVRSSAWRNIRLQRSHALPSAQAFAFLTPLLPGDEPRQEAPIPINSDEITFGYDPLQSSWIIEDPSLEACHARLVRDGKTFRLFDAASIAGSWVNYAPVPKDGVLIEHGDLIHLGRASFRFTLRNPGRARKPLIQNQEHGS